MARGAHKLERVGHSANDVLSRYLAAGHTPPDGAASSDGLPRADAPGRYDFDLAEFPLFRYHTHRVGGSDRSPLVYTDTITGKDGEQIEREWKCYPGAFGFGGVNAALVLRRHG